jgi:acyl-coenzyme A thioesterase PaaI-like protein
VTAASPDAPNPLTDVAAAARRVNEAVRTTAADDETLARAQAKLAEAADLLERAVHQGPHCQAGHERALGLDTWATPDRFFPYSPIVGPLNPISPPVELTVDDDLVVHGRVTLGACYNGPPWNLAHGGVIAAIFDELLGVATIVKAGGGFTGRLTIHYRKPTPVLEELELRASLDEVHGRKLIARGEIRAGGVLTADAEGLFVKVGGPLLDHDDAPAIGAAEPRSTTG